MIEALMYWRRAIFNCVVGNVVLYVLSAMDVSYALITVGIVFAYSLYKLPDILTRTLSKEELEKITTFQVIIMAIFVVLMQSIFGIVGGYLHGPL